MNPSPRSCRYFLADVFTGQAFAGNPLAVFPEGDDLSDAQMQRIARELNLSEAAFVCAPRVANGCRVRIFAPARELPFAGHPTIGTAHVLAHIGAFDFRDGDNHLEFLEGVGPVPIRVVMRDGRPAFCQFTAAVLPELGESLSSEAYASILGLLPEDVRDDRQGPDAVSCGVPFHMVPLTDHNRLGLVQLDMVSYNMWASRSWAASICVFANDPQIPHRYHMRVFSPSFGFYEDPATGAAAAALAGYLARREPQLDGSFQWEIWQGVAMGRPSQLYIEADKHQGRIEAIRVGGTAVVIGEGVLYL
ncbi:MAG: PhzF family phenazine biosynthesis protein [Moraxellaceae bacterium]|nr:PhzF family phenazine biosynthesis protein [Moraxellaceae bacterium]